MNERGTSDARGSVRVGTRLLSALGSAGAGGRVLATRLDLLRELGVGAARAQRADATASLSWAPAARCSIYAEIWEEAADAVGASLRALDDDAFAIDAGDGSTIVRYHYVGLDEPETLELALDRPAVQRLLAEAGVALPASIEVPTGDIDAGLSFVLGADGASVVKPARGTSGGKGVTCGVVDADDFLRARLRAARWGDRMVLERMAIGDEYRLLFLEGVVLDVLRRRPPRVVADGRSTVADLVRAENRRRAASRGRAGMSFLQIDLDCVLTLRRAGWSLRAIPPAGAVVVLKSTANENGAGDNETVDPGLLAPSVVDEARRAVDALGLVFAAVELITPEPGSPLAGSGGAILEVNGTPGLHYHYLVADPSGARRVAIPVLQRLLGGAPG